MTSVVANSVENEGEDKKGHPTIEVSHVVEQRFSNLAQGLLTLVAMTGPLLVVLGLIPQGVLAGLFFVMGIQALEANGMTSKILFLLRDRELTRPDEQLKRIKRRAAIFTFVAVQLLGFGATFAITQTIAAIGFPVFILLLIPMRTWLMPRWFQVDELDILDEPTASPFTMESVGGNFATGAHTAHRAPEAVPADSGITNRVAQHDNSQSHDIETCQITMRNNRGPANVE